MAARDASSCSAAASLAFFMLSLFRRSVVTAARRSTSAFHWAFVMLGGLGIGALGFLNFGWAGSVARRGPVNFFGGMAGGSGGNGGSCGGDRVGGEENGGKSEKTAGEATGVADSAGPCAFSLRPVPSGAPRCVGFGLGSPDVISAQTGEKQGSGGAAGDAPSEQHQDEELKHGHHDAPPRQQVNIEVAGPLNCWWATQCQQRAPSDGNLFAVHLMKVMDLLQGNLEGNSRLYKDPTLLMVTMN